MNSFQRKGSFLLLLFGSAVSASCQINWKKLEPGISGGVFIYQGDLSPSALGSYKTPGININLNVQKRLNPYYSLRTNLALGKLTGSDAAYAHPGYRQQRNFQFHTPVVELSELLVWNPLEGNRIRPYVFGGVGVSFLHINPDASNFNSDYFGLEPQVAAGIASDARHSKPALLPVVPVGVGVEYAITQKFGLTLETNYRLTRTDYLDGFSRAADPSLSDHYLSHSIGIRYHPANHSTMDCPSINY